MLTEGRPSAPPVAVRSAGPTARAAALAALDGSRPARPPIGDRVPPAPGDWPPTGRRGLTVTAPPVRSEVLPPPPAPAPVSHRPWVLGGLALVLGAALVAIAVVAALPDRADEPPEDVALADPPPSTTAPPPTAPPPEPTVPPGRPEEPPAEWRPEVLDLVRFVERERELTFTHPVHIDLLSDEEYAARTGGDDGSAGFYDGQRIVVRGTELTHAVEGTLVHELTHAIDDQHFDLAAMQGRAGGSPEASLATTSLVEGNAVRMEWAYDEMLIASGVDPAEVLDQAHTGAGIAGPPASSPPSGSPGPPPGPGTTTTTVGSRGRGSGAQQTPDPGEAASPAQPYGAGIPGLSAAVDHSPYFIGKQLIDVLLGEGGNAAVDRAFRDPPRTTEQVLDPRAYLARDEALRVGRQEPVVPKGEFQDQTSLGALNLYLVLAAGIDPVAALDAATGWGGESALAYTDAEGRDCVSVTVVGDTDADTAEIGEAFAAWADSGLAAHASTSRRGDAHVLTACDIAGGADTDPLEALALAEVRGVQTWVAIRDRGLDAGAAFAFGDCVVHALPLDAVLTPVTGGEPSPEVEAAAEGC